MSWEKKTQIWAWTDGDLRLGSGTLHQVISARQLQFFHLIRLKIVMEGFLFF